MLIRPLHRCIFLELFVTYATLESIVNINTGSMSLLEYNSLSAKIMSDF